MNRQQLNLLISRGEGLTVEFKEKFSSKIDRDIVALTNAKGGFVLFGVSDHGSITGEKLSNKMKSEIVTLARNCDPPIAIDYILQVDDVVVVKVKEGDDKPYSSSSGYFRRLDAVSQKMSQKEVVSVFRDASMTSFESLPCPDFILKDVSLSRVNAFLEESNNDMRVSRESVRSILTSLEILKKGKVNHAGVLMFAHHSGKFIPHCELICAAFKGVNKTHIYDRKDVREDLLTQFNTAMEFIRKHINLRSEIRETKRYDIYEIPMDAIREAVVNAIIHRDYSIHGSSIYVSVYDDRVEIENPGGLPLGLSVEDFGKTSLRRNLIIADLFHRMSKVERIGSGIIRMKDLMRSASLRDPDFEMTNFFRVSLYRAPQFSLKKNEVSVEVQKELDKSSEKGSEKSSEKIIAKIKEDPGITALQLAQMIGLTPRAIEKHLSKLKASGLIKRVGPDKGGYWVVADE